MNCSIQHSLCIMLIFHCVIIAVFSMQANPYLLVEASPEEIEAAKERDELINKPKSNYYLQPLLMSQKLHRYVFAWR